MKIADAALSLWPVLVETARRRQTITYGDLANVAGTKTPRLSRQLGVIYDWCVQTGRPPLSMVVVDTSSNLPLGPWTEVFGKKKIETVPLSKYVAVQRKVYARRWAADTKAFVQFVQKYGTGEE